MSSDYFDNLAVVLPRYGENLGGGAEALTQALVRHIYPGNDELGLFVRHVEVWTTCAIDHRTWANALPSGITVEEGITVRRFPVDERNLDTFIRHELAMRDGRALTIDEQLDWLASGVNSQELYRHIANNGNQFSAILFAPYLFSTTFWGALIHPERSLLIPCLHNEHYAYQDVFKHLFRTVRGLIFNSAPERELALQLYGEDLAQRSAVVGMGFDLLSRGVIPSANIDFKIGKQQIPRNYLLYSGRKEQGKNLDLLIECFSQFREDYRNRTKQESDLQLVIIGAGEITFCDTLPAAVVDLGFVSEQEKIQLMNNAVALCQPSVNESFSIVIMESWLCKTPVIVHGGCAVTRDHAIKSGGGLYFTNAGEFIAVLRELTQDEVLRKRLGNSGYSYVCREYSWTAVINRLREAFRTVGIVAERSIDDDITAVAEEAN